MEIAAPRPIEAVSAGYGPAFHKRWNWWVILGMCVVLAVLLVLVQTVTFVALLYIKFPTIMAAASHGDPGPLKELTASPRFLPQIFTPRGFLFIQLPTTLLMAGATILLARAWLGASLQDLGFGKAPAAQTILFGLGAGIVLFLISVLVGAAQDKLFGAHPQQIELIIRQHRGILAFTLDFFSAAILAPLWEETFFRGVFFTALVQRMPFWPAAILSGLAFGLGHMDRWNFLPLSILGVGLAYVYYRTGNIWANMVTHATINATDTILIYFFPALAN